MGQRRHSRSRGLEFFLWDRKGKSSIGNRIVHHRIASAVRRVEFVSDRVSHNSERSLV